MSDQNDPVLRVKDRRMFNPDGSLRPVDPEIEAERRNEEPAPERAADPATPPPVPAPPVEAAKPELAVEPNTAPALDDEPPLQPGEPSMFNELIVNLASQAAMYLGLVDNPLAPQIPPDLQAARQMIDILAMLQEKTRGNLTAEEAKLLDRILADLRMQYVSMTATRR